MAFQAPSNSNARTRTAYDEEIERLQQLQAFQEAESLFLTTEGQGVSEEASVVFGDETDLEDLSEEERQRRSTGRIDSIGLFI